MPASEEIAAVAFVLLSTFNTVRKGKKKKKKKKKNKKRWEKKFLEKGAFQANLLLAEPKIDGAGFTNFAQMSTTDFEILLQMVASKISRKNTEW